MKIIAVNDDGTLEGIYSEESNYIPDNNSEITEEVSFKITSHPLGVKAFLYQDGSVVENIEVKKELAIEKIKEWASSEINKMFPEWKQRNMIVRILELNEKRILDIALTDLESSEIQAIKDSWSAIKSIRSESDRVESVISSSININDDNFHEEPNIPNII